MTAVLLTREQFTFTVRGFQADTFGVVQFSGDEGLNQLYRFELLLASRRLDLDLEACLNQPASLTLHREGGGASVRHGILCDLEQLHELDGIGYYRAHLVPRLWWLTLTQHQQVFLEQPVPTILEAILREAGLTAREFEFRLKHSPYQPEPFVCQYQESHWQFLSRWLEREGIALFFEHPDSGEKAICTDDRAGHQDLPQDWNLVYRPAAGLEAPRADPSVWSFSSQHRLVPGTVLVKDYDYQRPSLDLEGRSQVDAQGQGQVYVYGANFQTPAEGARLAALRKEEILCRRNPYRGTSAVPQLAPGFLARLSGHFRPDCDRSYLITQVHHEGNQAGYLTEPQGATQAGIAAEVFYRNVFEAIPSDVQFRPQPRTPKPRVPGPLSAWIDGAGQGEHAELDGQGRYKVLLPFDLSGRKDGKASTYLRMAQPYAGAREGLHFPLLKGTEVLLTFIDGDPDRPLIAGAVPNTGTPSPVRDANQSANRIVTAAQNELRLEDQPGGEQILLRVPSASSFVSVGNALSLAPATIVSETASATVASKTASATVGGVQIQTDQQVWIQAAPASGSAGGTWTVYGSMPAPSQDQAGVDPGYLGLQEHAAAHTPMSWSSNFGNAYSYQQGRRYSLGKGGGYTVDCAETGMADQADDAAVKAGCLEYADPKGGTGGGSFYGDWTSIRGLRLSGMRADNTLVSKRYGNAYTFILGNSVEVRKGDQQKILQGGKHIDQEFMASGVKFYESTREIAHTDITTTTTTYGMRSGSPTSYAYSNLNSLKHFYLECKFSPAPVIRVSTQSTIAPHTTIAVSVHPRIDLEFSASLGFKLTGGMGFGMHVVTKPLVVTYNNSSGRFRFEGAGTKVEQEAALKASVVTMLLESCRTTLRQRGLHIENANFLLESGNLRMDLSDLKFF